ALALTEDFDIAVLVRENLEFDVARRTDKLFQVYIGGTERAARFALRLHEERGKILRIGDHTHAASAASSACFEDYRVSDLRRELACMLGALQHTGRTG